MKNHDWEDLNNYLLNAGDHNMHVRQLFTMEANMNETLVVLSQMDNEGAAHPCCLSHKDLEIRSYESGEKIKTHVELFSGTCLFFCCIYPLK